MICVEVEVDLEVSGIDAKAFVRCSICGNGTAGFSSDGAGHQFLGDKHGESLRSALRPIIEAGKHGVLIVEVVVEDGNQRSVERKALLEKARLGTVWILYVIGRAWAGPFHLKCHCGNAVCEKNVRPVLLFGLRGPFVADGSAIGLERKRAGNLACRALRGLDFGATFG